MLMNRLLVGIVCLVWCVVSFVKSVSLFMVVMVVVVVIVFFGSDDDVGVGVIVVVVNGIVVLAWVKCIMLFLIDFIDSVVRLSM